MPTQLINSFITGSADGTMKLYQLSGKRLLHTFVHSLPTADSATEDEVAPAVECVGFSTDAFKWVASGGMDKTLKIWDLNNASCRVVCNHGGSVVSLAWHASLPVVCTASLDQVVRIWDARTGNSLKELTGHSDIITNLSLKTVSSGLLPIEYNDKEMDIITTVSDDHTAKIFVVEISKLL